MTPECPFCSIAEGIDPTARVIYRGVNTVAFFPLRPATRGHTLVIHKSHREFVWQMSVTEMQEVSEAILFVAQTLKERLPVAGLNIIQSNGERATQTVPHVHFHVVPRYRRDHPILRWPKRVAERRAELDKTHKLLAMSDIAVNPEAIEQSIEVSPEDRRQHLSFLQAVITRMSQASSSAKTWLAPLVTVSYGYAITRNAPTVALLGLVSVLVFGILDANYLKREKAFRRLYDRVAAGEKIPRFSMNPSLPAPDTQSALISRRGRTDYWPNWPELKSWAIAPIYLPLVIAGVVIAARAASVA